MIDKNKLSRDYKADPVKRGEDINQSDLRYLYQELKLSIQQITSYLGITKHMLYKNIHKNNITRFAVSVPNTIINKIDLSCLSRDYIAQPLIGKEKPCKQDVVYLYTVAKLTKEEISEFFCHGKSAKYAAKLLSMYGIRCPSGIARERAQATMLTRYGAKTTLESTELKTKVENTNKLRYGVTNLLKDPKYRKYMHDLANTYEAKEKAKTNRKKTINKKYNRDFVTQATISSEALATLNNKDELLSLYSTMSASEIAEKLNVSDVTVGNYLSKHGIEIIHRTTSSAEKEIRRLLSSINFTKNRAVLSGVEIDLYSEEHHIGIEFNGNYWHSEVFKDKYYHRDKSYKALEKGVFLFHIFEYEWIDVRTKTAITNMLYNLFHLNKESIYARNCVCRDVTVNEAKDFLNKNHVQGETNAQIRVGLYCKEELVSLMEFTTNSINKKYSYELNRFCSKAGANVVGGASKLFKYFIKKYQPDSIISYSDIAKTRGTLYDILGFKHVHTTLPQYHWTNGNVTYSRYQTQRKKLIQYGWLNSPDDKRTESQIMRLHNFHRIYDCGKKVWVWERKKGT